MYRLGGRFDRRDIEVVLPIPENDFASGCRRNLVLTDRERDLSLRLFTARRGEQLVESVEIDVVEDDGVAVFDVVSRNRVQRFEDARA